MQDFTWAQFFFVLGLTTFAGLATGIGGALGVFVKKSNIKLLSFALGFSAGVMIYISFVELLASSQKELGKIYGNSTGYFYALGAFFVGIGVALLIDKCVPSEENPHELPWDHIPDRKPREVTFSAASIDEVCHAPKFSESDMRQSDECIKQEELNLPDQEKRALIDEEIISPSKVKRSGILFALAIGIHNFPEGLATFTAGMSTVSIGVPVAIAVALHNIPEGLTVSVPIYYGTGSRKKAFWYALLSGLSEPVGALLGFCVLMPFLTESVLYFLFSLVAGIMVFISFDELLPLSEKWGEHHMAIYGVMSGMAIMGGTLALLS